MPEVIKPEQEEHRSLLGAALSIEYGPCSVAAAELARAAERFIPSKISDKDITSKIMVSTMEFPVEELVYEVCLTQDKVVEVEGWNGRIQNQEQKTPLPFSIVQTWSKYTKPVTVPQEVVRHRTFRRNTTETVEKEIEKTFYKPKEKLLVYHLAGGQVLLPIATFEPRTDGNCSYVQIGPEINDDTVFVTQDDEHQTKRLAIIEDLRKLTLEDRMKAEYTRRIREFIHIESRRTADNLTIALGGHFTQQAKGYLNYHHAVTQSVVLIEQTGGDAPIYENAKVYHLGYGDSREGGTETQLALVQQADNKEAPITCGILARGNVCLPIATFSPETGTVSFYNENNLDSLSKYKTMMALVSITRYNRYNEEYRNKIQKEFQDIIDKEDATPLEYLHEVFSIKERIQSQLAPECEQQEKLARIIGERVLGVCFEGTVPDINMATTRGSVSGHFKVEAVSEGFEVRIIAKPDALAGTEPNQIASFVYDPSNPLGESLPAGQDAEEFAMLLGGFKTCHT